MNKSRWKGIYNIYKPSGPTSHDIIDKMREITKIDKIGHGGTLDPLAEGVLVVAVSREYTKKISKYKNAEKEYKVRMRLGVVSETIDLGSELKEKSDKEPNKKEVLSVMKKFEGDLNQVPPVYSAAKYKGVPSYKLARKGKKPNLPPRKIRVHEIKLLSYKYPFLEMWMKTDPGTYVRSIARDIGKTLNTGAVVTKLIRERVGDFKIENSLTIEEFKKKAPTF